MSTATLTRSVATLLITSFLSSAALAGDGLQLQPAALSSHAIERALTLPDGVASLSADLSHVVDENSLQTRVGLGLTEALEVGVRAGFSLGGGQDQGGGQAPQSSGQSQGSGQGSGQGGGQGGKGRSNGGSKDGQGDGQGSGQGDGQASGQGDSSGAGNTLSADLGYRLVEGPIMDAAADLRVDASGGALSAWSLGALGRYRVGDSRALLVRPALVGRAANDQVDLDLSAGAALQIGDDFALEISTIVISAAVKGDGNKTETLLDTVPLQVTGTFAASGWLDLGGDLLLDDLLGDTRVTLLLGATARGRIF